MRKIVTYFLLLDALPHPASSQFNIRIGAQVTITGALSLVLQNMNLVNNGSLSAGTGSIRMTGNVMTQIQGTGPLNLHDLVVHNNAGVTLQRNITVANHLELNGTLFGKNNTITLGNTATIINEDGNNRLTDDQAGTGNTTTTRFFPAPLVNENSANSGIEFVINSNFVI